MKRKRPIKSNFGGSKNLLYPIPPFFRKEKIDKLKNGANSKHEFKDQEYLRRRDTVLDEVEDAIEAGIKL